MGKALLAGLHAICLVLGSAHRISGHCRPVAVRAFSWRPLACLGIISYSVYLYTPLLNVFGKRLCGDIPTDSLIWRVFGFSVIVAVGAAGY
ncbi:MAG: hypothetical protein JSV65_15065 [Armatimonadota bacterium]|nr:MAG: hypothetical protein JSV65_15065 [Armatimonadota bacterium]